MTPKNRTTAAEDLLEIRRMMERSSKFLSLSGMAGIGAGIVALLGAIAAYAKFSGFNPQVEASGYSQIVWFLIIDGSVVLLLALGAAIFFTTRMAKRKSLPMWNHTSRQLIQNLAGPLFVGFILCIIFLVRGNANLIAPVMLLFYGMALLHASKYTLPEIQYLAWSEMILGLGAATFPEMGLYFWATGFGLCHIIYGSIMYFRYERKEAKRRH